MPAKKKVNERGTYTIKSKQSKQKSRLRQIIIIAVTVVVVAALGLVGWSIYNSQAPFNEPAFVINGVTYDMGYYIETLKSYYGKVPSQNLSGYESYGDQEIEQFAGYVEEQIIRNHIIILGSKALGIEVDRSIVEAELKEAGIEVTDEYVDIIMAQKLLEQQVPATQPQVHVQAILAENEAAGLRAKARLEAGEDFEEVATEVSRFPGADVYSNDFGWLTQREADLKAGSEKFGEIIFSAETGVITGPVYDESVTKKFGYWVMKVVERREATEDTSAAIKLKGILAGSWQEAEDIIEQLNAGADMDELAKELSQYPGAAENGADVGWLYESQATGDKAFLFTLEVDEISRPISDDLVTTKGGYWVFKVLERDDNRELTSEQQNTLIEDLLARLEAVLQNEPDYNVENLLTDEKRIFAIDQVVLAQGKGSVFIRDASLPSGIAGREYEYKLEVYGTKKGNTWSITEGNLPTGLSLDSKTGLISGVPAYAGGASFTIEVNNGIHYWSQEMFIQIRFPVSIKTEALPDARVGEEYAVTLEALAESETVTWEIIEGSLPEGLELDTTTGKISGTPVATGTSTITIQAKDAYTMDSKTLTLNVVD